MAEDGLNEDHTIEAGAAAIQALMNGPAEQPANDAPAAQPAADANSPQPDPQRQADAEMPPEDDQAQAGAPEIPDPQPSREPARPAWQDAPEYRAALAEAVRARDEANAARSSYVERQKNAVTQSYAALQADFPEVKTRVDLLNLGRTEPDRYNEFQLRYAGIQADEQEYQAAQREAQVAAETEISRTEQAEVAKLHETFHDLKDPIKGPAFAAKLRAFAFQNGYTQADLNSRNKAADWVMLNNAMELAESKGALEAAKKAAADKARNAPQVQKPGTPRQTATREDSINADFDRLKKGGGRVDDAAAVFRHIFPS